MDMNVKKQSAYLITEPSWGIYHKTPIWILEVCNESLFPVKFEYKQRGYKGLIFSEQINKIEFS